MCGIAGEVRFDGCVTAAPLKAMSLGIRHRGPDDDGLWLSEDARCGFSFRRLSIIDLSPGGHQPMLDPETGNAIVFNGEIYNFRSLRNECERDGEKFRSQSDTEVILALYRRHGIRCLDRLRGMFALALWDPRKQELFLARDRVGKKPLNYALTRDGLVFCSEIHPLSRHPLVSREHDPEALELYLQLLAVPAPWTIYKNIRKLPPAHLAIFGRGGMQTSRYWDVDYRRKVKLSGGDALDGFEEKLTDAVRLRMVADVPLGALLSGGVDSSAIVAAMSALSGKSVRTFSVGFREQEFNELPFAEQAARICGTDHLSQIVEGDVEALLPDLVRHYGEPYADSSAIPSFLISRTARKHVTVVLNGDGGDELLAGYPRYLLPPSTLWTSRLLGRAVPAESLASTAPRLAAKGGFIPRAASRALRQFVHPELGSVMSYRSYWDDCARRHLLRDGGVPDLVPDWRRRWLGRSLAHASHPVDQMLYFDNHTYLPDDLLVKMDIASMHCGLEARSPLLDHELIEFCASLPVNLKVSGKSGKHLLKELGARRFGREFVDRPKKGFGVPLERWLKGPLRDRMKGVVFEKDLMQPFDTGIVAKTVERFLGGDSASTSRVWSLFVYGLWRESANGPVQELG